MAYAVGPYTTAAGVPGEVHATQLNPVGAECQFVTTDDELGTYIYLPGVASTVAGSWVTFPSPTGLAACTTVLLTVTATGPVAIATAAVDAATKWGWYLVKGYYSGAIAGSNGTIVSGGGYLQCAEASEGTGRVCLGVSAGAGNFIFGAWSYSAQPDSDSAATGTPGADKIVVYVNFPFASKNY
jgi:hypothetical protein